MCRKFKSCKGIEMSPMELVLHNKLKSNNVVFFQEVMFSKCINPKTKQSLRFDFYLPAIDLLIEYDGKKYHQKEDVVIRDKIKDDFAKRNGITLVRLQGKAAINNFIKTICRYPKITPPPDATKKPKKKKVINRKPDKVLVSAIQLYQNGLQAPIISNAVKRQNKILAKKERQKAKQEVWKPTPYKRIAIIKPM